jgi:DNA-binding NtrC family response regulator
MRWPALFQDNAQPLFVLNAAKRIRFANAALESLAKLSAAELLGKACLRKGPTEPLFRILAPPAELNRKSFAMIRRPAPDQERGPPWWDISFLKLADTSGTIGYLGLVEVVAPLPGLPAKALPAQLGQLQSKHAERYRFELFAGTGLKEEHFRSLLKHAAESPSPVWLHGEPGSGKETAARILHHNGPRRDRPFLKIDAPALQPYLIEALLFGAAGLALGPRLGTLFVKEPAALPRDLQEKISAWLITDATAPRAIFASIEPPAKFVRDGTLRPEFATHLAAWELSPPPLRERLGELPRIVEAILHDFQQKPSLMEADFKALRAHRWPGNLNELRDALSDLSKGLPRYLREQVLFDHPAAAVPRPGLDAVLQAVEKQLLQQTLFECGGNQTEAAAKLGIPRARLLRRLDALGLS